MDLYSLVHMREPITASRIKCGQNFDFKIRRDHEKISYERRVYESVDD